MTRSPAPADHPELRSTETRMLSAELRGDERAWRHLKESLDGGWHEIMPSAVVLAALRRFTGRDLRLTTRFAQRFVERQAGTPFDPRDVEAVVRGVMGETRLLLAVDPARSGPIMYALLFGLVDDLELSDEQADALLAEAEQARDAAYRSANQPPGDLGSAPILNLGPHRRHRRRYLLDSDLTVNVAAEESSTPWLQRNEVRKRGRRRSRGKAGQPPTSIAGRYLRATLLRDRDERARLRAILDRAGVDDIDRVTRAAFAVAVRGYFHPNADLREIGALAAAAQDAFYDRLDLLKTEHLVRAALGEDLAVSDIDTWQEIGAKTLVLGTITDFLHQDKEAVNAFLAEAEAELATSDRPLFTTTP